MWAGRAAWQCVCDLVVSFQSVTQSSMTIVVTIGDEDVVLEAGGMEGISLKIIKWVAYFYLICGQVAFHSAGQSKSISVLIFLRIS